MDNEAIKKKVNVGHIILYVIYGMIIGIGAVLPGVSGGVLCVVFGIYKPIIDTLANPIKGLKTEAKIIIPAFCGIAVGFCVVARILGFLLDAYPNQSLCFFIGMISGTIPSLFKEASKDGKNKKCYISLVIGFAVVFSLLLSVMILSERSQLKLTPSFWTYIFCGFCAALSVIVPGLSISTFLMPLGLYTGLMTEIGKLNFAAIIPVGIGGLLTVLPLGRVASNLMKKYYGIVFHCIIGIVIAATVLTVPFESFMTGRKAVFINLAFYFGGIFAYLMFDRLTYKIKR